MLLTSANLSQIKYKTKRVSLKKADIEIMVALLPASVTKLAKDIKTQEEDSEEMKNFGFEIISKGVVDDKGQPVFNSLEEFESLPQAVQLEIQEAIFDFNGLSVKSQKQIEKN